MTLVRLEPAAPRSRVKHSTTEPLRSLEGFVFGPCVTVFSSFAISYLAEEERAGCFALL